MGRLVEISKADRDRKRGAAQGTAAGAVGGLSGTAAGAAAAEYLLTRRYGGINRRGALREAATMPKFLLKSPKGRRMYGRGAAGGAAVGAAIGAIQGADREKPVGKASEHARISKAKKRTTREDAGRGAAIGAAGFAAASPLHYGATPPGTPRKVAIPVRAGFTAGRAFRGGVIGGLAGMGVNALRRDQPVVKADRDENSSVPTSRALVMPKGPHQSRAVTAYTRSGAFAGKTRGVGRHLDRDADSSPPVRHVQPRTPDGKFTSHVNDLQIYHPQRYGTSSRQARDSRVGRWTKGGDSQAKTFIGKADDGEKRYDHAPRIPQANKVGRRIPEKTEVEKALRPVGEGLARNYSATMRAHGARDTRRMLGHKDVYLSRQARADFRGGRDGLPGRASADRMMGQRLRSIRQSAG